MLSRVADTEILQNGRTRWISSKKAGKGEEGDGFLGLKEGVPGAL